MIPVLADAVRTAMDRSIAEGVPFGRRDVLAWVDGDTKKCRPGSSIMSQVDKEIRSRRDAGEIVAAGTSPQGAALWAKPAPKPAPVVVDVCEVLEVEHPAAGYVMQDEPLSDAELDAVLAKSAVSDEAMALAAEVAAIVQVSEAPVYDTDFQPVEFKESVVVPQRFEMAGRTVLPNGVQWLWAAKTTDGQLFEDLEKAIKHQAMVDLDYLISEFLDDPSSEHLDRVCRTGLRAWEEFKARRAA